MLTTKTRLRSTRKKPNDETDQIRKQYVVDHPWCEIGFVLSRSDAPKIQKFYKTNCRGKSEHCHERQKRSQQGNLVDPINLMASCDPCNDWCEDNPDDAKKLGLVVLSYQEPSDIPVLRMEQ